MPERWRDLREAIKAMQLDDCLIWRVEEKDRANVRRLLCTPDFVGAFRTVAHGEKVYIVRVE